MERIVHSSARRRDHRLRSGALANRSHGWPRGESRPDIRLKWGKGSDLDDPLPPWTRQLPGRGTVGCVTYSLPKHGLLGLAPRAGCLPRAERRFRVDRSDAVELVDN